MKQQRVGVIMDGGSHDDGPRRHPGHDIVAALAQAGHDVVPIEVASETQLYAQLQQAKLDLAFLALDDSRWGNGRVQALLEVLRVPHTGSSVLSSALAADKLKAKELLRLHNVPTPPYYVLGADERERLLEMHGSFGYPVMVKPRRPTRAGVRVAHDAAELASAIDDAALLDDAALVERFITAKRIWVGLLDGRVLGAIEIAPESETETPRCSARGDGSSRYVMPARLAASRMLGVMNLAERATGALDCRGAVGVEVLVTDGGNEYVLEVNANPQLADGSLLQRVAAAAGYDFVALCQTIVAGARPVRRGGAAVPDDQPLAAQPMRVAV